MKKFLHKIMVNADFPTATPSKALPPIKNARAPPSSRYRFPVRYINFTHRMPTWLQRHSHILKVAERYIAARFLRQKLELPIQQVYSPRSRPLCSYKYYPPTHQGSIRTASKKVVQKNCNNDIQTPILWFVLAPSCFGF